MEEDLFGNKVNKDVDPAHKELRAYDQNTFDERLKRLGYVNKIFPFGQREYGSDESVRIFDEAIHSYIFGQFISTVILAQAFIERRFQEYFHFRFDKKRSRYTLDQLLKEFRKTGFVDDYFVEKIDRIRLKRNPFIHLRDPLHKDTLMARSFETKADPNKLLEDDAKDALGLMLIITKMRVL